MMTNSSQKRTGNNYKKKTWEMKINIEKLKYFD